MLENVARKSSLTKRLRNVKLKEGLRDNFKLFNSREQICMEKLKNFQKSCKAECVFKKLSANLQGKIVKFSQYVYEILTFVSKS